MGPIRSKKNKMSFKASRCDEYLRPREREARGTAEAVAGLGPAHSGPECGKNGQKSKCCIFRWQLCSATLNQTRKQFFAKFQLTNYFFWNFLRKNSPKFEVLKFVINPRQAPFLLVFTPKYLTTDEKSNKTFTFCAKTCCFPHVQALWEGPIRTHLQSISSAP